MREICHRCVFWRLSAAYCVVYLGSFRGSDGLILSSIRFISRVKRKSSTEVHYILGHDLETD